MTIAADRVRLAPDTVLAGDVYLVLDGATGTTVSLIGAAGPGLAEGAPLDPAGLDRLRAGDMAGTSASAFDAGGCGPEQDAADRGKQGPCGNVSRVALRPGTYAVSGASLDTGPVGSAVPIAVLTVTP